MVFIFTSKFNSLKLSLRTLIWHINDNSTSYFFVHIFIRWIKRYWGITVLSVINCYACILSIRSYCFFCYLFWICSVASYLWRIEFCPCSSLSFQVACYMPVAIVCYFTCYWILVAAIAVLIFISKVDYLQFFAFWLAWLLNNDRTSYVLIHFIVYAFFAWLVWYWG